MSFTSIRATIHLTRSAARKWILYSEYSQPEEVAAYDDTELCSKLQTIISIPGQLDIIFDKE